MFATGSLQGVDKDLKNLEPVVKQTMVEWGIWSPSLEAMIRNTQQFASRTFTGPKARPIPPFSHRRRQRNPRASGLRGYQASGK